MAMMLLLLAMMLLFVRMRSAGYDTADTLERVLRP